MEASLECARAGVTVGEWAQALREVFGEFRAPTGVSGSVGVADGGSEELQSVRERVTQAFLLGALEWLSGPVSSADQRRQILRRNLFGVDRNGAAVGTTQSLSYTVSGLACGTSFTIALVNEDAMPHNIATP